MTKKRNRFRRAKNRSGRADNNDTSSSHADQSYDHENRSILLSRKISKGQWEPETRTDSLQTEFARHDRRKSRGGDSQERQVYVIDDDRSSQHDSERRYTEEVPRAHTKDRRMDDAAVPEQRQRALFDQRMARRSSGSGGSPVLEIIHLDGRSPYRESGSIGTHFVHTGLRDSPSHDRTRGESFGQSRNRSSEFDEILAQRKKELGAEAAISFTGTTQLRDHPNTSENFKYATDQPRKGATASPQRARTEGTSGDKVWEAREGRDGYFGRSSSLESKSTPQPSQQPGWASPAARHILQDPPPK
ncbi:hypothetical protein NDN08_005255 [Rhodosorus marinus]|uniref:Uncharacterized protein n=1 Tax=Rhodosorus marinus TaxID=101924 RepID=A0AAV8V1E8_9RHOD|nr:hypothetical protein NDN08_005255 [Rhodosorus marinus]